MDAKVVGALLCVNLRASSGLKPEVDQMRYPFCWCALFSCLVIASFAVCRRKALVKSFLIDTKSFLGRVGSRSGRGQNNKEGDQRGVRPTGWTPARRAMQ